MENRPRGSAGGSGNVAPFGDDVETPADPIPIERRRLRIAFVVRHYHKRGGISRYVAALAERFAADHEVHVFAASFQDVDDSRLHIHRLPILSSAWLARRKQHAVNGFLEVLSFTLIASLVIDADEFDLFLPQGDFFGRYDAYTVHSCHKAWLAVARGDAHGIDRLKKSPFNPLHAFVLAVERHALRKARKIIAISEVTRREVLEHYRIAPERVVVVPIGVDLERFSPAWASFEERRSPPGSSQRSSSERADERRRVRERHGFAEDGIVALFPAHEFHRKGLADLIEAMERAALPRLRLLVVGRDDPAPFQALARRLGLDGQVIFAGGTAEIEAYYRASDLLVFPTRYEPFGMIITEALASGLPVVVSRLAGAAELITDQEEGILLNDPRNPDEIAGALRRLATDDALRARMGKLARKAAERYGWDSIFQRLQKEYGVESAPTTRGSRSEARL